MHFTLLQILFLLAAAFMLMTLAKKLHIAYPIFLVIAGLIISLIPGIPAISLNPDLIFLIFLPPLLFEAAWYTSWNDFWKWRRPIVLLSVALVILTSTIVAFTANALIPGFSLSAGFLLGGIIAPTDALSAASVLKNLKLPHRILAVLEGESLINDATGLIVFRFAMAAVLTGKFSIHEAVTDFFIVTSMGIFVGLIMAGVFYFIQRFLIGTPSISTAFTLLSPYFMYLVAEQFHFSGVISVVSGGLFLSYHSHKVLSDGQSRLQTLNVWSTLVIIFNSLVFILIGLELPLIVHSMKGYSLAEASRFGLAISLIVIVVRLACVYPATFIPRWLFKKIRSNEPNPSWKGAFIIGWTGMRGVVSLAAALSLPIMIGKGTYFPHRDLIIFITFSVILVTLLFQGLSLPFIIKAIRIRDEDPPVSDDQQESGINMQLTRVAIDFLHEKYAEDLRNNELLKGFYTKLQNNLAHHSHQLKCIECGLAKSDVKQYHLILKAVYEVQRNELYLLRKEQKYDDYALRKQEIQVDLAEVKIARPNRF